MTDAHPHLCETHIIGAETREWIVDALACPALREAGVLYAGVSEAAPGFAFVRRRPKFRLLLCAAEGAGEAWVDGAWRRIGAGEFLAAPAGVLHGYRQTGQAAWLVGWLTYRARPEDDPDGPSIGTGDGGRLTERLRDLCEEATQGGDPQVLRTLTLLVEAYARRLVLGVERDPRLVRLWRAVEAKLDRPWSLEALAESAGMSGEHLRRLCRRDLGRPPLTHLTRLRMERAAARLLRDQTSVSQAASEVGYDDSFAFSTAFKRAMGVSPSVYRRS